MSAIRQFERAMRFQFHGLAPVQDRLEHDLSYTTAGMLTSTFSSL